MRLERAKIINFRSLRDVSIDFSSHTALLGGNGAGKSSILKAIEKFYSTSKTLDKDDFYGRDQSQPVEIELTFSELTAEELDTFDSRVRDGRLTVTRVFDTSSGSGRYFGSVLQNKEFVALRSLAGANPKREAYKALQTSDKYTGQLEAANSAPAVEAALLKWEAANPDALTLERDDGQFFGFQNAGRGALQRHTSFVFIPAVRDAIADAQDGKVSPIGKLLEILVRSSILKRAEVIKFQQDVLEGYRKIVSPENMPELGLLAGGLTTDLQELYGNAAVDLTWREAGEIPIPLPAADVTLSDDGFGGPVDRQGHGLQRAFVFTLLQHLARATTLPPAGEAQPETTNVTVPNLILAIEEPELYQHPTKQRHLAQVLRRLSAGELPGTHGSTQIVFASHSPMFVSLGHADEIRLVRRTDCEDGKFKECVLQSLDLSSIAGHLELAGRKPKGSYTAESLIPRLHMLGSELAEGFFADGVVLVEGPSDKAALYAAAKMSGLNFEASGIAVLCVGGKTALDRPYAIFRELGIPTYVIWDCDSKESKHKADKNIEILRLICPDENIIAIDEITLISDGYAHFCHTVEDCLETELTKEIFEKCLAEACAPYGFDPSKDAQKIPQIMHSLLVSAQKYGKECSTLNALIVAIWKNIKGVDLVSSKPPLALTA